MTAQLTFWLETLGCKVNQYEAQALREAWIAAGWREEAADPRVIVFNSCAVTARAVADLRQRIRQAHAANPSARIVLTGCAAQVLGHELRALPGIAAVVPQAAKDSLLKGPLQDSPGNEPHAPPPTAQPSRAFLLSSSITLSAPGRCARFRMDAPSTAPTASYRSPAAHHGADRCRIFFMKPAGCCPLATARSSSRALTWGSTQQRMDHKTSGIC